MDVSIILCSCNRAQHLQQTLDNLKTVELPTGCSCELLLVDNASSDDTPRVMEEFEHPDFQVRRLRQPHAGRSRSHAMNMALRESRGQVLLFTDDDVRFPRHWIDGMTRPILTGQADALVGGVEIPPYLQKPWMEKLHHLCMGSTDWVSLDHPHAMIGANMACSREVLSKVPEFDLFLGPGGLGFEDDTLFSRQIVAAGYRLGTALDVVVEHHFDPSRLTRKAFRDRARRGGFSLGYVAHHWEHHAIRLPHLRYLKARLRLFALRWKRRAELRSLEAPPEWELSAMFLVHFYEQFLRERRHPHHYEKHGLVQLRFD